MQLKEQTEEKNGGSKPALTPIDDSPIQREHEEDHKRRHHILLPNKTSIMDSGCSSGIEQGSNDACKSTIVAASENVGEQSCRRRQ